MKLFSAVCAALAAGSALAEATVDSVSVRQDWPWSKNVNVEVVVSGAGAAGVDLRVEAFDGETSLGEIKVSALAKGSLFGVKNGTTRLAIDPAKAFPSASGAFAAFTLAVSVVGASDPLLDRIEYRVIDLVTCETNDLRRRDFYEHPETYGAYTKDYSTVGPGFVSSLAANETFIWTQLNSNDVYKTTKMAFKRIPAKDVVWTMGPAEDDTEAKAAGYWSHSIMGESRIQVKLSKDYYMGVFELSQRQYELLTGERPSYFTNQTAWATYPVERVELSWQNFVAKINGTKAFGFKVPTEAQWEFATCAGYEGTGLPNGKERTAPNFDELEGYSVTRGHTDRNATSAIYKVGVGRPNGYGLFNTLGNVSEWIAEESNTNLGTYYSGRAKPVVDPVCTQNNLAPSYGDLRGGNYNRMYWRYAQRLATPDGQGLVWDQPLWGWRVCMDAE